MFCIGIKQDIEIRYEKCDGYKRCNLLMKESKEEKQEQIQMSRVRKRRVKQSERIFVILCCVWLASSILLTMGQMATDELMTLESIAQDTFVNISLSMSTGGLVAFWSVKRKYSKKLNQSGRMEKCITIIVIAMVISILAQYLLPQIGKLVLVICMAVANAVICVWCCAISDKLGAT